MLPHALLPPLPALFRAETKIIALIKPQFEVGRGKVGELPQDTPILNELAGSLNIDASLDDYRAYLEEKYLGDAGKDS